MKKICVICSKEYKGFGNNAEPIMKGRCCDKCNEGVIVPIRLGRMVIRLAKKYGHK